MQASGSAGNTTPRSGPTAHTSEVGASEEGNEDIVAVPVNKDLPGKEISDFLFDPQKCEHRNTWLTISQVDDETSPLQAVS